MKEHTIEQISKMKFVGWRETVSLPKFKLKELRAKIDTGAKTSALHADKIEYISVNGIPYVRFLFIDDEGENIYVKAPLLEERTIKSSNGDKTIRPVVQTEIKMGSERFMIEVTLINRDMMGFKMLIGREALNGRFLINPAKHNMLKTSKKEKTQ
ncbi:MAG: RimK/LysX family protein [Bdellovibrionales bacterium]|nr:RimK/LysX family protein [Bdellovibrionales bacterium]